jgi:hypothetical protein
MPRSMALHIDENDLIVSHYVAWRSAFLRFDVQCSMQAM